MQFADLVDGKIRRYTPDYLVETISADGEPMFYLVEVKEERVLNKIRDANPPGLDARKFMAATEWCANQDRMAFMLVSEKWLEAQGLENVRAIMSRESYTASDALLRSIVGYSSYPASLAELVEFGQTIEEPRSVVVSSLLRLCADDHLRFDITKPLHDETVLDRGGRNRIFS